MNMSLHWDRQDTTEGTFNPSLPTGESEVGDGITGLNTQNHALYIAENIDDETIRLQYRYLDLRRLTYKTYIRHKTCKAIDYLDEKAF